ncbi:protein NO VEIN domain-containing protein [Shouchella hunanensis]|uniref:DUF3883 domain-containing protein n=1 Tax=Shouchella hunanensis TaxID=766894 RepID=A0ABY7WFU2_9BACI|nr:DUF3883 domain-containing protein [Shouchella hunanensis]WDF05535.1 DUF3883 domain-containing protein [Shouchella hunanensis]
MAYYVIPNEFHYPLHHTRPRFKRNLENVLFYVSSEISRIGKETKVEFQNQYMNSLKRFPGNSTSTKKTLDNWRTEIDALFGLIYYDETNASPTKNAKELADNQDLVKFFKRFSYKFQYPSGALKNHFIRDYIKKEIFFRPGPYIIKMLNDAEKESGIRCGLSKVEAAYCIFNDLRVTRDQRAPLNSWELIKDNRLKKLAYNYTGDYVRYAGDILDYLVIARMLKLNPDGKYYLNKTESLAIERFCQPDKPFTEYETVDINSTSVLREINNLNNSWINYMNEEIDDDYFNTDVLALITGDSTDEYIALKDHLEMLTNGEVNPKKIGDIGESLIVNHEKLYLKLNEREDLCHLVKLIPTDLAVGYDISSRGLDATSKYIEVKTTASNSRLNFSRFHLTTNEWNTADSSRGNYFVYRLLVSSEDVRLHVLQDPVGLYKKDKIRMYPKDGADIIFDPDECGFSEKLLFV